MRPKRKEAIKNVVQIKSFLRETNDIENITKNIILCKRHSHSHNYCSVPKLTNEVVKCCNQHNCWICIIIQVDTYEFKSGEKYLLAGITIV